MQPITVSTYDSAFLHGAFGACLLVSTSATIPGPSYSLAAQFCPGPLPLGLTATPERADGRQSELESLVGPIVYRKEIAISRGPILPVRLSVSASI